MVWFSEISVRTTTRKEFVDITRNVLDAVRKSGIKNGIVTLYVPHTTAAITINENADPSVKADIIENLVRLIPEGFHYKHVEGNADSHIQASIIGPSETVIINDGRLLLGTWQGIFFCEFDGPRTRRVWVKIIGE